MTADQTLPTGIVTFLFTDIESSTRLWEKHGEQMRAVLSRHDALLGTAVREQGGYVVKTTGDGLLAAFGSTSAALQAALAAQHGLLAEPWPEIAPDAVRVRMGLHCGEAELRDGDYFGTTLNRAARVMALGHGGQILLSGAAAALLDAKLPPETTLRDMGEHALRGLSHQEQIFQVVAPGLVQDFPPLKSGEPVTGNLPPRLNTFVGRTRQMAEVREALQQTRLLTLTGPGGTGKTRLSLQVAADVQDQYRHGTWLVELAPVTDPALVVEAVNAALKLGSGRSSAQTLEILFDYLREKELLLVLDNCEHLIDASARLVAGLLETCPNLTILASSREGLNVYGERTYHLPTLGLPAETAVSAADIAYSEAVQLFVTRAESVQPGFRLNDDNATAVAQVVRRLDGIPLAIELAAARLKVFTVAQIAARLDDRFRLLTGGSRTALPRQQTLRALIDWSYDLLNEDERTLFRWLAVFVGGWTLEAAESIAGSLDIYQLLPDLVSKSLVTTQAEAAYAEWAGEPALAEPRYFFLETIRQYARDRLVESGEVAQARDRHFAYFEELGDRVRFGDGPDMALMADGRIVVELDNLRGAMEWGTDRFPHRVLGLIWNLFPILADQDTGSQLLGWTSGALQRLEEMPAEAAATASEVTVARHKGLVASSLFMLLMGLLQEARRTAAEAFALLEGPQTDPMLTALALFVQAEASYMLEDPLYGAFATQAADFLRQAHRHSYSKPLLAIHLNYASIWHAREGETELAQRELAEARNLAGESGPEGVPWLPYSSLMLSLQTQLDPDMTRERVAAAIAALRRSGNRRMGAMLESDLGHRSRREGSFKEALEIYGRVLPEWRVLGHRAAVANILENIAFVDRAQGRFERAATLLGAAERIRGEVGQDMLPPEREEYERELAAVTEALPKGRLDALWAKGRAMSMDALIDLAQRTPEAEQAE